MMVDARGKLGGHVFSKNRGGAYVRTKVTPANPMTAAQVAQRALLASASQSWRGLTEEQRLAWNGAVSNYATTNVFGDIVNPTGATLHTRLNINVALVGGSALSTPPMPVGISSPAGLSLTAQSGTPSFEIAWSSGAVPTGTKMVVEASPQVSSGRYNVNNRFRVIGTVAAAATSPQDLISEYEAKFGSLVVGQKVFVRVKYINITTGEVSQTLVASAIVAA